MCGRYTNTTVNASALGHRFTFDERSIRLETLGRANVCPTEAVLAVVVYLAVASSSVLLPLVATYVAPARTDRWLRATQDWLRAHGSVVTAVVVGRLLIRYAA